VAESIFSLGEALVARFGNLDSVFKKMDENGDGVLDREEIDHAIRNLGFPFEEVGVLQHVAVCCSVLQYYLLPWVPLCRGSYVAVCCSVLQFVAVMLQCVAVLFETSCSPLQRFVCAT